MQICHMITAKVHTQLLRTTTTTSV